MLRIENISKRYSRNLILKDVSCTVPERSITGIIGPNGAGKSTLLRIITGIENADRGEVSFNGTLLSSFDEKRRLFSYMPEHLQIYPDYSVERFLEFIHKATGHKDTPLLEALHLSKVGLKKIRHLSKGFQQRMKLYFALCNKKKTMLLDEPFDGFDPIQLQEILDLIRKEREGGRTFLISIHQLFDAEKLCTRYVLLDEGRVVAEGDMEALRREFGLPGASLERLFMEALR
jgi:ABC-2 type transport system ATP-binding protein